MSGAHHAIVLDTRLSIECESAALQRVICSRLSTLLVRYGRLKDHCVDVGATSVQCVDHSSNTVLKEPLKIAASELSALSHTTARERERLDLLPAALETAADFLSVVEDACPCYITLIACSVPNVTGELEAALSRICTQMCVEFDIILLRTDELSPSIVAQMTALLTAAADIDSNVLSITRVANECSSYDKILRSWAARECRRVGATLKLGTGTELPLTVGPSHFPPPNHDLPTQLCMIKAVHLSSFDLGHVTGPPVLAHCVRPIDLEHRNSCEFALDDVPSSQMARQSALRQQCEMSSTQLPPKCSRTAPTDFEQFQCACRKFCECTSLLSSRDIGLLCSATYTSTTLDTAKSAGQSHLVDGYLPSYFLLIAGSKSRTSLMLLPVCAEENVIHDRHADVYNFAQAEEYANWHGETSESSNNNAIRTNAGAGMRTSDIDENTGVHIDAEQDESAPSTMGSCADEDTDAESLQRSRHTDNGFHADDNGQSHKPSTSEETEVDGLRATLAHASPVDFNPLLLHCGLFDAEHSKLRRTMPHHQQQHKRKESHLNKANLQTCTTNRTAMRQHPSGRLTAHKCKKFHRQCQQSTKHESREDTFEFRFSDGSSSNSEVRSISASSNSDSDYFESSKPQPQQRRSKRTSRSRTKKG